jgi:hypothetical protein
MTRRRAALLLLNAASLLSFRDTMAAGRRARRAQFVSRIPAVTEMIYAMGDGARVAAVSNYDHFLLKSPPAARRRAARSSVERILAIAGPVIVYATQKELIERLDRAGFRISATSTRRCPTS